MVIGNRSTETYIALFRGINVGGRNALPMKELVSLLVNLGCKNVKTYIQSGNLVFRSPIRGVAGFAQEISVAVGNRRRYRPRVLALNPDKLERAVKTNPFPEAETDLKSRQLAFLDAVSSKPDRNIPAAAPRAI
jgi:uncharacterized protein (DUF1697 family)